MVRGAVSQMGYIRFDRRNKAKVFFKTVFVEK